MSSTTSMCSRSHDTRSLWYYKQILALHEKWKMLAPISKKLRCWKPRKTRNTIGRLIWVPPSTGEVFYLRRMLTHVKGATSYIDIKTVNNVTYSTFREACLALGILTNDTEYVEAIREAKDWGSGHYLRKLFVTILLSNSVNHLEDLWNKTWE